MTHYFRNGNRYNVAKDTAIDIKDTLPAGNYVVKHDPRVGFYLETVDSFSTPSKLYGNTTKYAEKILNTYEDRPGNTGVMLSGEKGSGKTLLSKVVSILGLEKGYPTLIVNEPYNDDDFFTLIQSIEQPCIVFFDEFEKVYDHKQQESILTLFDGVFSGKKLFLITCNDKYKINDHMRNRPGRIYYAIDFTGLDEKFIVEYCDDVLINKTHTNRICAISKLFFDFNFDMLKAMVEEVNRYNEDPIEILTILNTKPQSQNNYTNYTVKEFTPKCELRKLEEDVIYCNPMSASFTLEYETNEKDEDGDCVIKSSTFGPSDLVTMNAKQKKYTFVNSIGETAVLVKKDTEIDMLKFLM